MTDANGRVVYAGQYSKGKRCGFGILRIAEGTVFEGLVESLDDFVFHDGFGKEVRADGTMFFGHLLEDEYDGFGLLKEPNGTTYSGQFELGLRNGIGKETLKDGAAYFGSFVEGKCEDLGLLTQSNDGIPVARFEDDKGLGHGECDEELSLGCPMNLASQKTEVAC